MRKDRLVSEMLGEEFALTPSDLYGKEFKRTTLRGYDPKEVDEYLERVADVLESMIVQMRVAREKNDEQRENLDRYREMEDTLRNALVSSQKLGEDIVETARREAHTIVEEAKLRKAALELEASRLPEQLARDIDALEQQRHRLRQELKAILETHRKLLDALLPEAPPSAPESPAGFFEVQSAGETTEESPKQETRPTRKPLVRKRDLLLGAVPPEPEEAEPASEGEPAAPEVEGVAADDEMEEGSL